MLLQYRVYAFGITQIGRLVYSHPKECILCKVYDEACLIHIHNTHTYTQLYIFILHTKHLQNKS